MCRIIFRLLCFIGYIVTCLSSNPPIVKIDLGEISGGYEYSFNGRKLYSFLGVPYASPPVQNYRFKVLKPIYLLIAQFHLK